LFSKALSCIAYSFRCLLKLALPAPRDVDALSLRGKTNRPGSGVQNLRRPLQENSTNISMWFSGTIERCDEANAGYRSISDRVLGRFCWRVEGLSGDLARSALSFGNGFCHCFPSRSGPPTPVAAAPC